MIKIWIALAVGLGAALECSVHACSTPVFRYALERWDPAPYPLLVFHRGPLTPAALEALKSLELPGRPANVEVTPVEVSGNLLPAVRQIWERHTNAPLPWAVLRYPASEAETADAWAGPLHAPTLAQLVDSPVRREILRRLSVGDAAVWVLLECGQAADDQAAAKLLEAELKKASRTIELPPDPDTDQTNVVALKAVFSLLRVPRQTPEEELFIRTLLAVDPGLSARSNAITVPVFGRGRAMCALPSSQLNPQVIQEMAAFVTGPCSCEVKDLNPGVDMLMAADWPTVVSGPRLSDPPSAPLPGLGAVVKPPARATVVAAAAEPAPPSTLWRNVLWIGMGLVLGLVTATLAMARKRKG
jgi:hypothetical protein